MHSASGLLIGTVSPMKLETLPLLRLDSSRCQWNLDSGFLELQSPKLRIPDSTSKIFPKYGIPIPLHGATFEYMHVAAAYIDPHCSAANLTQLY